MTFEWDVLISYAHVDNQPLRAGGQGWVTRFHHLLEARLTQLMGKQPRILCRTVNSSPENASSGQKFTGSVSTTAAPSAPRGSAGDTPSAALFVTVLSPNYLRSKNCIGELQKFTQAAARAGGLWLAGGGCRIFKVVRSPVPLERQPLELQGVWEYNCFDVDGEPPGEPERNSRQAVRSGRAGESERAEHSGRDDHFDEALTYLQVVDDLAYDIENLLSQPIAREADGIDTAREENDSPADKIVYLAETSRHLAAIRDDVRRELELAGYWVLPDRPLPRTHGFAEEIQASLALCDLSVHLLDATDALLPGNAPPLSASEVASLHQETTRLKTQVKLAANRLSDAGFSQILWVPNRQGRDYWETMLDTLPRLPEVLLTGVEELKTVIQSYLDDDGEPSVLQSEPFREGGQDGAAEHSPKVYVDFDQQDADDPVLAQIQDWFGERFEVLVPNYSAGEGVGSSEAKLRQADGVLIYYGQGSDVWLKRRLNALRKICSSRQPVSRAVYVGQPVTPHKRNLAVTQVSVLHPSEPFSSDVLQLFATRIANSQEG